MKHIKLISGILGLVIFSFLALNAINLSILNIFTFFVFVGIYSNGLVTNMLHMSREKTECINYDYNFEWGNVGLGFANYIPIIMEIQYLRHTKYFLDSIIEEYTSEGYQAPFIFRVGKAINTVPVYFISLIGLLASLALPFVLNDYDLYLGVTREILITTVLAMSTIIHLSCIGINNYCIYKVVNFSIGDGGVRKFGRGFITVSLIFTIYTTLMLLLTFILGFTGIQLSIMNTLFNLNVLGIFVVISPVIGFIQANIVKNNLSLYQYVLNESL